MLWTIDTLRDGAETAGLWNDISHRKTPLMLLVIEPLVLKDRLKHVPTHSVLKALFGDVMDGYSRQAHTKFREELGRKHMKFRPKRKGF